MTSRIAALVIAGLCCSMSARAEDEDLETILEGFDDEPAIHEPPPPSYAELPVRFSAEATLGATYNYAHDEPVGTATDHRGLSRARLGLRATIDIDWWFLEARISGKGFRDALYAIEDREDYTHQQLQAYEADLELSDTWVRVSPISQMDVKVGRQVVAWGRSETLRVVDVLNPGDNREPGLIDLADLRLPVTMTRVDYYVGQVALTGIAIHESRFNKEPAFGHDFFPVGLPQLPVDRPESGGDDTEWAAALSGRFSGWDASLHWARVFEDRPRLSPLTGRLEHYEIELTGATGNYVIGDWVFKGEVARNRNIRFFAAPLETFKRTDVLVGLEYSGIRDSFLTVEVVARRIHRFRPAFEASPDFAERTRVETAVRYNGSFRNDTLHVTLLGVLFGEWGRDGATYRASIRKDMGSGFSAELGVALYDGGDFFVFDAIEDNDRAYVTFRYAF